MKAKEKTEGKEKMENNTYDKVSLITFLEKEIKVLKEKEKALEETNNKIIEEAKVKRDAFMVKAESLIPSFNEKLLSEKLDIIRKQRTIKTLIKSIFTKKEIEPKPDQILINKGLIKTKFGYRSTLDSFIAYVCKESGVEYQGEHVCVKGLLQRGIKGFEPNIGPVVYMEYWLDRINCISESYLIKEEFNPEYLFAWPKEETVEKSVNVVKE